MAIVIDGVTLPEFPEGLLDETNKYCTVFDVNYGGLEDLPEDVTIPPLYMAIASSSPGFYVPKELNSLNANAFGMVAIVCDVVTKMTMYEIGAGAPWENPIDYIKQMGFAVENIEAAGMLGIPKWTNYDIKTATQFTKTDEPYTIGDEIYFPNSETPAEPEYGKIRRQHMRDIGDAIRRKTGKTDKMPPEQMASEIDSIVTADNALVLKDNERIYQLGVGVNALSAGGLLATNISGKVLS